MSRLPHLLGMLLCLTLLGAPPTHAGTGDTTTGLAAHWKLDETTGTTANDSTGASNGTMLGGLDAGNDSVSGLVGTALDFDGADDYIDSGFGPNYSTTDDFTISVWFRPDLTSGADDESVIGSYANPDLIGIEIDRNGSICGTNELAFEITDSASQKDTLCASYGNTVSWHHIVLSYDAGGNALVYIDGALAESVAIASDSAAKDFSTRPIFIGTRNANGSPEANGYLNGKIDDVRFYDRALTADDITALYVRSDKYCDSPTDAPGIIRYNADRSALQYCDGKNWVMMGLGSYTPVGAHFDSANDYLVKTGDFDGASDTSKVTGSFWVRRDATGEQDRILRKMNSGVDNFLINFKANDTLVIQSEIIDTNWILNAETNATFDTNWHHVLFSIDLSDTAKRHLFIDGTLDSTSYFSYDSASKFPLTTGLDTGIGASPNGTSSSDIDLADLWIDFGTYIDFSSAALREKFISANDMPMFLGEDGSLPTGASPDVFMSGDVADWHTNKGTGGGFTENGEITYASAQMYPSVGLIAHWPLNEKTGSTIAYDMAGDNIGYASGSVIFGSAGKLGSAAEFDGNGYINLGDFDIDGSFTAMGWIKTDASGLNRKNHIIGKYSSNSDQRSFYLYARDDNRFQFYVSEDCVGPIAFTTSPLAAVLTADSWYHVAGTFDASTGKLSVYVDGNLEDTDTVPGANSVCQHDFPMRVGSIFSTIDQNVDGTLDDVRLYDRALTAAEIAALANDVSCSSPSGQPGEIIYNTDHKVMQYCNGRDWVAMSKIGGTGGSGCASPAGDPGEIRYAYADEVMQYCNSEDWVNIGKPAAPESGLVGHWRLDEKSGTTATDGAGGNDGTMQGGLDAGSDSTAGRIGSALDFDGSDDHITTGTTFTEIDKDSAGWSVSAWLHADVMPPDRPNADTVWAHSIDTNDRVSLQVFGGEVVAGIYDGSTYFTQKGGSIGAQEWHHAVAVYDGADIHLWIDGVESLSMPNGVPTTAVNSGFVIGSRTDGSSFYFDGLIDDVRIYNRALSAQEVNDLYNATK